MDIAVLGQSSQIHNLKNYTTICAEYLRFKTGTEILWHEMETVVTGFL